MQRAQARHTHAQVGVAGDRQAARQHDLDGVAAFAQAPDDALERQRDAVDLGRVGLGDDRHPQPPALRTRRVDDHGQFERGAHSHVHAPMVAPPCVSAMTAMRRVVTRSSRTLGTIAGARRRPPRPIPTRRTR
ncbi:MAG: hypothetical protein MUE62_13625 [Burkholderiaceae bacterium]|nr:hypothetical protein [Burkholderiaceae bacterium]